LANSPPGEEIYPSLSDHFEGGQKADQGKPVGHGHSYDQTAEQGPRSFWLGFLVMLLFAGAGFFGSSWAFDRILLEKALYDRGVVASGRLLEKRQIESNTSQRASEGTIYELTYRFETDSGIRTGESRVSAEKFFSLQRGDPLEVRYLPDAPGRNLPEGSRLPGLFWMFAVIGLIVGLGAIVVVIGMVVTRLRGE
jgi:hypothetical protein